MQPTRVDEAVLGWIQAIAASVRLWGLPTEHGEGVAPRARFSLRAMRQLHVMARLQQYTQSIAS